MEVDYLEGSKTGTCKTSGIPSIHIPEIAGDSEGDFLQITPPAAAQEPIPPWFCKRSNIIVAGPIADLNLIECSDL